MKPLFTYHRSAYWIVEASMAIVLISFLISISAKTNTPLAYAFVIVVTLLITGFILEMLGTVRHSLQRRKYRTAIVHSLPYIVGVIIGIIVIVGILEWRH